MLGEARPLREFQVSVWRFVWVFKKKKKQFTMRRNPSFCLSTVLLPLQFPPRVSELSGLHTDCSCYVGVYNVLWGQGPLLHSDVWLSGCGKPIPQNKINS